MRRLVLHIGLPKTSSTALQEFLSGNRFELARHGIRWSASLYGPNHLALPFAFTERTDRLTATVGVRDSDDQRRLRKQIRRRLRRELDDGRLLLISSEQLSGHLRTAAELAATAEFLHDLADDVTVIAVIRRADFWLPSAYSEAVVGGRAKPQNAGFVRSRRHLLDHRSLVDRWVVAFGGDSVRILPFLESDKGNPMAVPRRFLGELDIPGSVVNAWPAPATLARTSLSAFGTELLRQMNPSVPRLVLRPGRDRLRLQQAISARFPGRGPGLTPRAAAALERKGWVWTGVDQAPQSVGDGWSEWTSQPRAEVQRAPKPTAEQVQQVLDTLRRERVVRDHDWPGAQRARSLALRALKR